MFWRIELSIWSQDLLSEIETDLLGPNIDLEARSKQWDAVDDQHFKIYWSLSRRALQIYLPIKSKAGKWHELSLEITVTGSWRCFFNGFERWEEISRGKRHRSDGGQKRQKNLDPCFSEFESSRLLINKQNLREVDRTVVGLFLATDLPSFVRNLISACRLSRPIEIIAFVDRALN